MEDAAAAATDTDTHQLMDDNASWPLSNRIVLALLLVFILTRNGRRLLTRASVSVAKRYIFLLPVRLRYSMIALGLRLPFGFQRALLKAMQAPENEHYQSMVRVRQDHWTGHWIAHDIRKHKHPMAWMCSTAAEADLVILFIHGGGFHLGTSTQYMPAFVNMIEQLKRNHQIKDTRILSVDYALSPMAAHPKALDECVSAYRYLVHSLSISPSRIIIAGDSAGGNLTAETVLKIRDMRQDDALADLPPIPLPAGAAMISPWVDLADDRATQADHDVATDFVRSWQIRSYLPGYVPRLKGLDHAAQRQVLQQPSVSPAYADYRRGFCPVYVSIGGGELIRPQIEAFASKLESEGVDVHVARRDGAPHVYVVEPNVATSKAQWLDDLKTLTDWMAKTTLASTMTAK